MSTPTSTEPPGSVLERLGSTTCAFIRRLVFNASGRKAMVFLVGSLFAWYRVISAEQWILVACGVAGLVTIEKIGERILRVVGTGVSGLLPAPKVDEP